MPSDKDGAEQEQIQILEGIVRKCWWRARIGRSWVDRSPSPDRRNPSTFPVTVIEPRTRAAAAMNALSEFPAADDRHGNTSL
jgi:hypothetical protein